MSEESSRAATELATVDIGSARAIHTTERDHNLTLDQPGWPQAQPGAGWAISDGCLARLVKVRDPVRDRGERVLEVVLRFPSAPIYGLNRVHQHLVNLERGTNYHTFRIFRSPDHRLEPASAIYLLNNGLNEIDQHTLYYRLARHIISEDPTAVCLLRALPGHLTRFPFPGRLAERPLDRYLRDGADLFRQFVRFMVEAQWLFSVLTTQASFQTPSGAALLAPSDSPRESRLSSGHLADRLQEDWDAMLAASNEAMRDHLADTSDTPGLPMNINASEIQDCINAVRREIGWEGLPRYSGELPTANAGAIQMPIHAVGYSLGGFVAQSLFITWPFLVSSCTTICAGGALRDMAPSAFAHPEEWQTVLHSLRYELDNAMSSRKFDSDGTAVAGIDAALFEYLQRVFYEVFEQKYRGAYQSRVSEYSRRLLFVVGGNDPIVKPQSVLDAAPPEGVNLIEIANMSHFLASRARDELEEEQRSYWIPEVSGIISRFGREAASVHAKALLRNWLIDGYSRPRLPAKTLEDSPLEEELTEADARQIGSDGALSSPIFEKYLDTLVGRVHHGRGLLFIFQNEMPTELLPMAGIRRRAMALHHSDDRITQYWLGVERRKRVLSSTGSRVVVTLPKTVRRDLLTAEPTGRSPARSEAPIGYLPVTYDVDTVWNDFQTMWLGEQSPNMVQIRYSNGGDLTDSLKAKHPRLLQSGRASLRLQDDEPLWVAALPDAWIWVSEKALGLSHQAHRERAIKEFIETLGHKAFEGDSDFGEQIRKGDDLVVVQVSRAAYNARFRGRSVRDSDGAGVLVGHAALVLSDSEGAMRDAAR